ncbi:unnamed protein product [Linum tenue]|uniref:Uncharacterized protein n=1 Tax=Linum tenue TaxID=586396 RepID=A0AAV0GNZ8_9ROSI|nr:unnamed protein product [Linum tenue]
MVDGLSRILVGIGGRSRPFPPLFLFIDDGIGVYQPGNHCSIPRIQIDAAENSLLLPLSSCRSQFHRRLGRTESLASQKEECGGSKARLVVLVMLYGRLNDAFISRCPSADKEKEARSPANWTAAGGRLISKNSARTE